MKVGMRKPSLKKSISARTTGKVKRTIKKTVVPGYGKKGSGWIKDPKKAVYNKVYNKTTFGVNDLIGTDVDAFLGTSSGKKNSKNNMESSTYRVTSKTYRRSGTFAICAGIIILLLALLLTLAVPLTGVLFIFFGTLFIVLGITFRKHAEKMRLEEESENV